MKAQELRQRYLDFFSKKHGHAVILGASLIPENDPTVLFTTAGMHPLVPYLMGEKHPSGTRLVDVQKCIRTGDIEEVGDNTHCTFFEMLGNWSLGDYFKEKAIQMSCEFLTSPLEEGGLGLDPNRLAVTVFEGDADAPRDEEAANVWRSLGMNRIYYYPKKENWWGPAGITGPCGPDTEMFYYNSEDLSQIDAHEPAADGNPWVEIWNDVFMQYNKNEDDSFTPLTQQNVDTGMGLDRVVAILQKKKSVFETELFEPAMQKIADLAERRSEKSERILADHLKAATMILGDDRGVTPSNNDQGYVLRKLIRRAIRHGRKLGIKGFFTADIAEIFVGIYGDFYPEIKRNQGKIREQLQKEEEQFQKALLRGEQELAKELGRMGENSGEKFPGERAFYYFETHGFPLEMTDEILAEQNMSVDKEGFQKAFEKHQELSRAGAEQKFAGGLADHSFETRRLHTATHLLLEALRQVLGKHVEQRGSNITAERLRFDFNNPEKMTPEQIAEVEQIVDRAIKADYPISFQEMTVQEARDIHATGIFIDKYESDLGGRVKVYFMGDFSTEICGGPHVEHTGQLGHGFKILKEESSSSGVRRIKAILE